MPGTIILRPIQANLNQGEPLPTKVDPYCMIILGDQKIKSPATKTGNVFEWNEAIAVKKIPKEEFCYVEIKDRKDQTCDGTLGTCKIDLTGFDDYAKVTKWYNMYQDEKYTGKILIEATFSPEAYWEPERLNKKTTEKAIIKDKQGKSWGLYEG